MPGESKNVTNLREAYQRWHDSKASDTERWLSFCDEEIRLTSLAAGAPKVEFTRTRSGRADFANYLKELVRDWSMNYYRVTEFIEQGDRVVAIGSCSWTHKQTGKTAETPKIDIWRFRDGRAVEFSEFYDTARVLAAAS